MHAQQAEGYSGGAGASSSVLEAGTSGRQGAAAASTGQISGASPRATAAKSAPSDLAPNPVASTATATNAATAAAVATAPPERDLLAFDSGPMEAAAREDETTGARGTKASDPFGASDGGDGGPASGAVGDHNSDPFTGGPVPVATGPPPAPLQAPNGHANPFALAERTTSTKSPTGGSSPAPVRQQQTQPGSSSAANPFGSNAFASGTLPPPPIVVPGQQAPAAPSQMQPSPQGVPGSQQQQFPGQSAPPGYGSIPPGYGMPPNYSSSFGQYGPYGAPATGYGAPSPTGGPPFGMFGAPPTATWPGPAPHMGGMHGVPGPFGGPPGAGQHMYGTTPNPFGGGFGASATGMPALGYGAPPANPFASTATGSVPSWNPNVNRDTFNDLLIEHNKRSNPTPPMAAPMRAKADQPSAMAP
jgi:hypothetical protein